jgi:hypothetical protein
MKRNRILKYMLSLKDYTFWGWFQTVLCHWGRLLACERSFYKMVDLGDASDFLLPVLVLRNLRKQGFHVEFLDITRDIQIPIVFKLHFLASVASSRNNDEGASLQ